jgi:hypothetical protein
VPSTPAYGALKARFPAVRLRCPFPRLPAYPDPVIPSQSPTPQTLAELAALVEILQHKLEGEIQRARYLAATALTMAIVMPLVVYWALHGTL